jgi:hypothetical protein
MSFWLGVVLVTLLFLAAAEIGFRLGRASHAGEDDRVRAQYISVQGSTLGLLALLLSFTLAMANARFANRQSVNVSEAGAVQTAYIVADGLPEAERQTSHRLLKDYVNARRMFFAATGYTVAAASARAHAIQNDLVTLASGLTRGQPGTALFVTFASAVAEIVRLEQARELALAARLPPSVHGLVVGVAIVAMGVAGFVAGFLRRRSVLTLFVVPLLISFAYLMIEDLERSRAGFISTGDAPMMKVQEMIERSVPTASRR